MLTAPQKTHHAPYHITLSSALSECVQHTVIDLLALLPKTSVNEVQPSTLDTVVESEQKGAATQTIDNDLAITIKNLVDGRGLACPMPLLKTKVALRDVAVGEALYVIATDPNSQADITAFCRQSQTSNTVSLDILLNTATDSVIADDELKQNVDTIFHFIITKRDSN